MLRIFFTHQDIARIKLANTPDPLWEVLLSRFRLRDRQRAMAFQPWSQWLRAGGPNQTERMKPGIRILSALAPLGPYIPDFLTPPDAGDGLDAGLDAIRSTPRQQLRCQLTRLAEHSPVPGWVHPLADADRDVLAELVNGLRAYHDTAIRPYQDVLHATVDADYARRARDLLTAGIEGLVAGMGRVMRWRAPVLEVDYAVDRDIHLHGQGLRLVPSFFSQHTADSLVDPDLPPVLVYPIDEECRWAQAIVNTDGRPVDTLIGPNRAAVLRAAAVGVVTTTQLAYRARTSLSSASRHATVLRDAGLLTTHREGPALVHSLTPLGLAILKYS